MTPGSSFVIVAFPVIHREAVSEAMKAQVDRFLKTILYRERTANAEGIHTEG